MIKNEYIGNFNQNNFASIDVNSKGNQNEMLNEDGITKNKSFTNSKMGNH